MHELARLMHEFPPLVSVLRNCAWLVILCVLFVPLEYLFAAHRRKNGRKTTLGDLGFYFISGFVPHWLLIIPLSLTAVAAYRLVPWRVHVFVATWPIWLSGLAAFVVADLGFYWGHRLVHKVRFLWRFHQVHHDPEEIYFLISARAHPVDNMIIRLCGLVPIYLLGLGAPESVKGTLTATLIMLAMTVWGFFIHANLRWRFGPLEWLLATPRFHHWHHTKSAIRDRNFASMLPVWDWIFGTHYRAASFPAAYGLDEPLPASVLSQLLYPLHAPEDTVESAETAPR
jgi:sterol desaturase/sphingolipid hydroxylase (fatty acid hydroxylase superfamily)